MFSIEQIVVLYVVMVLIHFLWNYLVFERYDEYLSGYAEDDPIIIKNEIFHYIITPFFIYDDNIYKYFFMYLSGVILTLKVSIIYDINIILWTISALLIVLILIVSHITQGLNDATKGNKKELYKFREVAIVTSFILISVNIMNMI